MGVGHSTVYEEPQVYKFAVRYLLETTPPLPVTPTAKSILTEPAPTFEYEPFDPRIPGNPFFLPWAMRGILEDTQIRALFSDELKQLREQFGHWHPKTKALQQVKAALEPLRLPKSMLSNEVKKLPESLYTGKNPNIQKTIAKL